jgi:hypothetical protein
MPDAGVVVPMHRYAAKVEEAAIICRAMQISSVDDERVFSDY